MSEPLAAERTPRPDAAGAAALAERVVANLGSAVHASRETLRLPFLCLLAEGHVLVEDVPGVGKTVLAKALAKSKEDRFATCGEFAAAMTAAVSNGAAPHAPETGRETPAPAARRAGGRRALVIGGSAVAALALAAAMTTPRVSEPAST